MPKEVVFLFSMNEKPRLFESLTENLTAVFGNEIHTSAHDPDSAAAADFCGGDLYLAMKNADVSSLRGLLPNLEDLLFVTRAVRRDAIAKLESIPPGSSALVVNDSYELSLQTANCLFEMGLSHITWVAFDPKRPNWSRYQNLRVAVTPNEAHLVPPYIRDVIDIGDRQIDTYSMVRIATKLGLDSDEINSRLLQYSQSVAEPNSSITKQYLDNFLKSSVLQRYVHTQPEGVLFCDQTGRLLYANERASAIFERDLQQEGLMLGDIFAGLSVPAPQEEFTSDAILIGSCHYSMRKSEIVMYGAKIGFSLSFQDEKSIRENETNLMRNLARRGLRAKATFSDIISSSPEMKECLALAKKAAGTDFAVLIEGESGTGKELLAQAIHNESPRSSNPFVAVNCAALPESLLESELFGYEGGSFTGALRQGKSGLFEQANGGTLFLDEIGDMPSPLQAMLLRVLQEKQFLRVGGSQLISVDVRIIAASNKKLSDEVAQKRFRADLYYRLNVLPLHVPPLRRRTGDIPLLLKHFLAGEYAALSQGQRNYLQQQTWPGNVRQLQNFSYYFKTTLKLDGFFSESTGEVLDESFDLLTLIKQNSAPGHGVGRAALLALCRERDVMVSDAWLRKELSRLQDAGYITIGRGRSGCQLTERGNRHLAGLE